VIKTPENWMIADSTPILRLLDNRLGLNSLFYPEGICLEKEKTNKQTNKQKILIGITGAIIAISEEYFDEWTFRVAISSRWNYKESRDFAAPRIGAERNSEDPGFFEEQIRNWGKK